MKALILAAGYATRLYPLTRDRAKPLLPVGGKPIIDYIVEAIEAVKKIDLIYVISNDKFSPAFQEWADSGKFSTPIEIINDGTTSDDDKLGAIGDIKCALEQKKIDDDLLVVGGDNLFELDLGKVVRFFKKNGTTVVAYDVGDKEIAKRYGIVAIDNSKRIMDFQEKPKNPLSTLAAIAMYLYPRDKLRLFQVYADEGNNLDQPGRFIQWLYRKEPVYAYAYEGVWYDIGDLEMYKKADELYSKNSRQSPVAGS